MLLPITALYAALMVAIMVWLGWGIGAMRGKTQISIGFGDSKELAEAGAPLRQLHRACADGAGFDGHRRTEWHSRRVSAHCRRPAGAVAHRPSPWGSTTTTWGIPCAWSARAAACC